MRKKQSKYVITYDLDNIGTAILLTWIEDNTKTLNPYDVFCTSKVGFVDRVDGFLFDRCNKKSEIIFIGFDKNDQKMFEKNYRDYRQVYFINKEDRNVTVISSVLKKFQNKAKFLNEDQLKLIKYVDDWASYKFNDSMSYKLNIIFRTCKLTKFIEYFADGYLHEIDKQFENYIHNHIVLFLKEKEKANIVNIKDKTFLFVDSKIKFLDDFCYSYFKDNRADVICLIDTERNKVYWRTCRGNDIDINTLNKKLCNGDGLTYACSGEITDKFLGFIKQI